MSNFETERCRLRYVSNHHFLKYHRINVLNLNCSKGTANFKCPLSGISAELANLTLKRYFKKPVKLNYIHQTKLWDWVELDKYAPHRKLQQDAAPSPNGFGKWVGCSFHAETSKLYHLIYSVTKLSTEWVQISLCLQFFCLLVHSELNKTIRRMYKNRIDFYSVRINHPLFFSYNLCE